VPHHGPVTAGTEQGVTSHWLSVAYFSLRAALCRSCGSGAAPSALPCGLPVVLPQSAAAQPEHSLAKAVHALW